MINYIKLGLIITLSVLTILLLNLDNINPNWNILYKVKRLQEKTYFNFKSDPAGKADYLSLLLDKRLVELENLTNDEKYQYLLSSSLRYAATAGELTDLVKVNNLDNKMPDLKSKFTSHKVRLQYLLDVYPKDIDGNVEHKYLIDDINYLDLYLAKL